MKVAVVGAVDPHLINQAGVEADGNDARLHLLRRDTDRGEDIAAIPCCLTDGVGQMLQGLGSRLLPDGRFDRRGEGGGSENVRPLDMNPADGRADGDEGDIVAGVLCMGRGNGDCRHAGQIQ